MVFGEVVAVKAGAIVGLGKAQPFLEMLRERPAAVVEMIEDPEAHTFPPHFITDSEALDVALSRSASQGDAVIFPLLIAGGNVGADAASALAGLDQNRQGGGINR